jgi:cyclophilin family peptidyl-prolyl cis-trans isomerase
MSEKVILETTLGKIKLELDSAKAPKTVANFLAYVDEGMERYSTGSFLTS